MIDIASLNPLGLYVAAGGLAVASLNYVLVLRRREAHWKARTERAEQKLTDAESLAAELNNDICFAEDTRTTALNIAADARQERDTAQAALQAALSELARRPAVVRDARGRWAKSKV